MKLLFAFNVCVILGTVLVLTSASHNDGFERNSMCICSLNYAPVCGRDGRTYGNQCSMKCSNVKLAYRGKCRNNRTGHNMALDYHYPEYAESY